MKKRVTLFLSCLFISIGLIFAQTTVPSNGTVVDETGEPLIGVSVAVKGTTTGTITDIDGNFTLNVPSNSSVLVFSLVGMSPAEHKASTNMRITMQQDSQILDEVMVVAYGTASKKSFTGSAGVVTSKDVAKLQVSSISKALEGAVPGLQAASDGGQPGSNATLRIRGYSSLAAGNSPLIVLDGIVFDGNLNQISPQDVSSITVLKDAASAALYGSRAANGVILITTKKGNAQKGKPQVSLEIRQGMNKRGQAFYDSLTDPGQYFTTYWQALYNDDLNAEKPSGNPGKYASDNLIKKLGYNPYMDVANEQVVDNNGNLASDLQRRYNDKWRDEMFKTGYRQEYNLSISSGSQKSSSYLSLGYLSDEGIIDNTDFERFSGRLNQSYEIARGLNISGSLAYSKTVQNQIKSATNTGAASNAFAFVQEIAPIYPVYMYDLNGKIMTDDAGNARYDYGDGLMPGTVGSRGFASNQNPIAAAHDDKNRRTADAVMSRGSFDYSFLDGFKVAANFGYDVKDQKRDVFYNSLYGDSKGTGRIMKYSTRLQSTTFNQLLSYTKTLSQVHNISAMIGHESYDKKYRYMKSEKQNVYIPGLDEFNNSLTMSDIKSYQYKKSLESYLSNFLYDYAQKYYFSFSFRRDGSSVFHKDNRWGNFWSVGGSWRINHEEFMQSTSSWLDNLRLRLSYGTSGNDVMLNDSGEEVYKPYEDLYTLDPTGGLSLYYKGNKDLKWEKNNTINVGFDFAAFNNRLNVEFDFFVRKSSDLLYNQPVSPSEGYNYIPINIGDMKNTGLDFTISGDPIKTKDFTLNLVFTGSHVKNKITKLPQDPIKSPTGYKNYILRVGGTIADFYLLEYAGVDPNNGNSLWYYMDSKTGEKKTTSDATFATSNNGRIVAGSALPDFTGTFAVNVRYKQFDFGVQSMFQLGGKIMDDSYMNLMHSGKSGRNWHKDILNAWTPNNRNTNVPRLQTTYNNANYSSTRFLIDADYFTLRNITLGYTFDKKLLETLKLSGLRVYAVADNIATISHRKGLDPRQSLSSGVTEDKRATGQSDYGYTPISSYSLGVSLNF